MSKQKMKKRSDYKTERGYINYLWKQNKERIQSKTPEVDKRIFSARVQEIMSELRREKGRKKAPSHKEAVTKLLRTEEYLSRADRLAENAMNAIRADKEALYELRRATGWKEKLDVSKLKWNSKEKMYEYTGPNGSVFIDFTNSPKVIRFWRNKVTGKTIKRLTPHAKKSI